MSSTPSQPTDLSPAAPAEQAAAAELTPVAPTEKAAVAEMSPAACGARLAELFPALFKGAPKPVKLRIQVDIQERAPGVFSKSVLSAFFRRYTGSHAYLMAVSKGQQRFDLDGQPAGELTDEHRKVANDELARRRTNQNARRDQEEAEQRARYDLLCAFETTKLTESNFCALKGIALDALPALLEQARQEAKERAERPQRPQQRHDGRPDGRREGRGPQRNADGRPQGRPEGGRGPGGGGGGGGGGRPAQARRGDRPSGDRPNDRPKAPPKVDAPQADAPQNDGPKDDGQASA